MPREYKMYINGEWVGALEGGVYDDLNPYTGEVFARVSAGDSRVDTLLDCLLRRNHHVPSRPSINPHIIQCPY